MFSGTHLNEIHVRATPVRSLSVVATPIPEEDEYDSARTYMRSQGWPLGLQNTLIQSLNKFPVRFVVVDNSGSMRTNDGHRLVDTTNGPRSLECSRWTELSETLRFHGNLAYRLHAHTEFLFLNGVSSIVIGDSDDASYVRTLESVLDDAPRGKTPLCRRISEVVEKIQVMKSYLLANNQRAVVVVASDGEATDGNLADAMRPLQNLPVWVVVRLCTDDENVVSYWNNIDRQLEIDMDVLDDLFGEAAEVKSGNQWLTYGQPLHRLREWGVHLRELDLIDQCSLSLQDMWTVCATLLACDLPHPELQWEEFITQLRSAIESDNGTFDPIKRRHSPWVKVNKVIKTYRHMRTTNWLRRIMASVL